MANLASLNERILDCPQLKGFNVTIPFKVDIISKCKSLSKEAESIGAVNCVKVERTENSFELHGFNTDAFGFEISLKSWYKSHLNKAMIFGNGGAAKAAAYVLNELNIPFINVVRQITSENQITFDKLNENLMSQYDLLINCTPVGTFPNVHDSLNIDSGWINNGHQYYDMVYNPAETATMTLFKSRGASIKNGLEMLHLQADKSWEIWTA